MTWYSDLVLMDRWIIIFLRNLVRSLHFSPLDKIPCSPALPLTGKSGAEKTASSNVVRIWWALTSEEPVKWKMTSEGVQQSTSPKSYPKTYRPKFHWTLLVRNLPWKKCLVNILWSSDVRRSIVHQLSNLLPVSSLSGPLVIKSVSISISWVFNKAYCFEFFSSHWEIFSFPIY